MYTDEHVDKICQMYMKYIEEWIAPPDEDEREFFIMEKTHPTFDIIETDLVNTEQTPMMKQNILLKMVFILQFPVSLLTHFYNIM